MANQETLWMWCLDDFVLEEISANIMSCHIYIIIPYGSDKPSSIEWTLVRCLDRYL